MLEIRWVSLEQGGNKTQEMVGWNGMKILPSSGAVFWMFPVFTQRCWPPQRTRDPKYFKYTWNHMVLKTRRALSLAMHFFCIKKLRLTKIYDLVIVFSLVFSRLISPCFTQFWIHQMFVPAWLGSIEFQTLLETSTGLGKAWLVDVLPWNLCCLCCLCLVTQDSDGWRDIA